MLTNRNRQVLGTETLSSEARRRQIVVPIRTHLSSTILNSFLNFFAIATASQPSGPLAFSKLHADWRIKSKPKIPSEIWPFHSNLWLRLMPIFLCFNISSCPLPIDVYLDDGQVTLYCLVGECQRHTYSHPRNLRALSAAKNRRVVCTKMNERSNTPCIFPIFFFSASSHQSWK